VSKCQNLPQSRNLRKKLAAKNLELRTWHPREVLNRGPEAKRHEVLDDEGCVVAHGDTLAEIETWLAELGSEKREMDELERDIEGVVAEHVGKQTAA
jgi:hypothetical protein